MAVSVPLSRFTSPVGGGTALIFRCHTTRMDKQSAIEILRCSTIGVALCFGLVFLHRKMVARANVILQNWARQHDLELVHFERSFFTGGFGWLTTSRNQVVYFVRVRDRSQRERSGWVRCGSFWGGIIFNNEAEVKWKDTQS